VIYKKGSPQDKTTARSSNTSGSASKKMPTFHYVKQGDTLWTISKKYEVTIDKIKKLNNLKDGNIKPGQKLKLS
jgi:membrane-bound lytic murein transglycosylase D